MSIQREAAQLRELIRNALSIVALTGAGISTEAGIPDFRSPGGLWDRFDPMETFSLEGFHRDPKVLFQVASELLDPLADAEPTSAHRLLADLEAEDKLTAVITQNIDGLHQKAGSKRVYEVHGSLRSATCQSCRAKYPLPDMQTLVERAKKGAVPQCTVCGGVVKPDIVLFGELLPTDVFDAAMQAARSADLMLVIGSSLIVSPAAELPLLTLDNGGSLVIATMTPTPYDHRATLTLRHPLGELIMAYQELPPLG